MVFGARTAVPFRELSGLLGPSSSPEGEDSPVRVLVVEDERRLAAGLPVADGG
jgi:hypothetical protein